MKNIFSLAKQNIDIEDIKRQNDLSDETIELVRLFNILSYEKNILYKLGVYKSNSQELWAYPFSKWKQMYNSYIVREFKN